MSTSLDERLKLDRDEEVQAAREELADLQAEAVFAGGVDKLDAEQVTRLRKALEATGEQAARWESPVKKVLSYLAWIPGHPELTKEERKLRATHEKKLAALRHLENEGIKKAREECAVAFSQLTGLTTAIAVHRATKKANPVLWRQCVKET